MTTKLAFNQIDGNAVSIKDFGAVGDGTTDDTAAIIAALAAASDSDTVVEFMSGEDYRITSTLTVSGKRINGNNARIIKDFDGIGIDVTGGAVFSYIRDLRIDPSATYQASDYNAAATSHGIRVTGTRVDFRNVTSNNHVGAGFYLDQPSGNMNRCKFYNIVAGGNALAGGYMTGDFTGGADDMSVWEFNGQFANNYGHGLFVNNECPIRQSNFWIYSENNMLGATFPASGEYDISLNRINACNLWIYSEKIGGSNQEILAGTNSNKCFIFSARRNTDADTGSANAWFAGNQVYNPTTGGSRNSVPSQITSTLARVGTSGEYTEQEYTGSGGTFGAMRGEGNGAGTPWMKMMSASRNSEVRLNDQQQSTVINNEDRFRVDNTTTAGETSLQLWDVDTGARVRVTVGAADSGGTGFKVLRIPN